MLDSSAAIPQFEHATFLLSDEADDTTVAVLPVAVCVVLHVTPPDVAVAFVGDGVRISVGITVACTGITVFIITIAEELSELLRDLRSA